MKSAIHCLLGLTLFLPTAAFAMEDCANGVDDDGVNGADCADPQCAPDPFCTDLCGNTYAFVSGPSVGTVEQFWEFQPGGFNQLPATGGPGQDEARLRLDLNIPVSRPAATLELILQKGTPQPLRVCRDAQCTQTLLTLSGASGGIGHVGANFFDGQFDHVFFDLSASRGQTVSIFLVQGSPGQPATGMTRLEGLRLFSDVDTDGSPDGSAAGCDACWDVDHDGAASLDSPGNCGPADCDDGDPQVSPNRVEDCTNAKDDDCDQLVDSLDPEDCGVEDCANGVDDTGEGLVDCGDPACAGDAACSVCQPVLEFVSGPGGVSTSDNDPDVNPSTQVFRLGSSPAHGGRVGFSTALSGSVAAQDTGGKGHVAAALTRTFSVPATVPNPQLTLRYALDGDAAPGRDVLAVCFDVLPENCVVGTSAPIWSTDVNTGTVIVSQEIPLPPGSAGSAVSVVVVYDTVDSANNLNLGAFVDSLAIGSDLDDDGQGENSASVTCDRCVDSDGDGAGRDGLPAAFTAACVNPEPDCDDEAPDTFPGAQELCASPGDQDCNGLDDPEEPSCSVCGDGQITAGEFCDDGGVVPGDGCSDACLLEAGALTLTELHLTRFDPSALGEQWVELTNTTSHAIDLRASRVRLAADVELQLSACDVVGSSLVPPGGSRVVALGAADTTDGLAADLACPAGATLSGAHPIVVSAGPTAIDTVNLASFSCELARATGPSVGRSLIASSVNATANDSAAGWCLAGVSNSYSNSGRHYGSPGAQGGCAEVLCDGADDDCDGVTDQGFPDADADGTCDALDCAPLVKTCAADCVTDVDGDNTPDCRDGCIDADLDGWGSPGGALVSTCKTLGGQPRVDCDDTLSFVSPEGVESNAGGACTNGLDDNCDGKADCSDAACGLVPACAGESCAAPTPLVCGSTVTVEPESNDSTCGSGADSVFVFTGALDSTVIIEVQNLGRLQYGAFFSKATCSGTCPAGLPPVASTCAAPGAGSVAVSAGVPLYITLDNVAPCAGSGSGAARLTLRCAETCTGGIDDDADGKIDCADSDCVAAPNCANVDLDGDGRANGLELICGTDPVNPGSVPTADDVLNPDGDALLNCVDPDDDADGTPDAVELVQCALNPTAKNDSDIHPGGALQCSVGGVDGDCNGLFDSESAACGFIEQQCGDGLDNDGDGKADCLDIDCVNLPICGLADFDNDGVSNRTEIQCNTKVTLASSKPSDQAASDDDNDGLAACVDTDDDGDGAEDNEELLCGSDPNSAASTPPDLDGDGQCDAFDDDDDADGFTDLVEIDCGSDPASAGSRPDQPGFDLDGDGVCDARDPDRDGDGWTNAEENTCGTNLANAADNPTSAGLDVDNDGLCDAVDDDDDGDLWKDAVELLCQTDRRDANDVPVDTDLDGTCDLLDSDTDGDLWPDALELQCGTSPLVAADNPGALGQDKDGDLLCDKVDDDDDNDGWLDAVELQCGTDPLVKSSAPVDTDGDKTCDANDDDDDGDGALDSTELLCGTDPLDGAKKPADSDGDGLCDALDPDADPDGDGWSSSKEGLCGTLADDPTSTPTDADGDGLCDALSLDDDGDGWPDTVEVACGHSPVDFADAPLDTDNDGTCDSIDTDDDGDGVPDAAEILCGTNSLKASEKPTTLDLVDLDGDTLVGCVDTDDDGDGASDLSELKIGSNPLVADTDGDGLLDGEEDANDNGIRDPNETSPLLRDTDGDGLSDRVEAESCYIGDGAAAACQKTSGTDPDSDDDGLADGVEDANHDGAPGSKETNPLKPDTDGDGANDGLERGCRTDPLSAASVPLDLDGSGVCDGGEQDSDGDGIADGVEAVCKTNPLDKKSVPDLGTLVDTDGDKILDCGDDDDDDDGIPDWQELACGTAPLDATSTPSAADVADTDGDKQLDCADPDDDNDGLPDTGEAALGTDPLDADTDDDGLLDGHEVLVTGTSPVTADTDGDGIQDGTELGVTSTGPFTGPSFKADADPSTTTDPRSSDTDGDGLPDGAEDANANGRVDTGESDPNAAADGRQDTDGDGLPDVVELNTCEDGMCLDPLSPDTDGDGVSDKLEKDVYLTSPFKADTDGGGIADGIELELGTDPLDPSDDFQEATVSGNNVFRCDAGGGQKGRWAWAPWLLLGALALARGRRRAGRSAALLVCLAGGAALLGPASAAAQATGDMNIENFFPAGGRYRVFSVEQAVVGPAWQPYGHLRFHGEFDTLRLQTGTVEQVLVASQNVADLGVGIGLGDWAQLEVDLPFIASVESGEGVNAIAPISGAGLGDLVIRVRGTFVPNRVGGFGMGMSLAATVPTGDGTRFRGDPGVGVLANLVFDHRSERVDVALNAGVRIRTEEVSFLGRTFGNELTYGLGVDISLLRRRIDMGVELFGRTPLTSPFTEASNTTLELLAGPKWWMWEGLGLEAHVGAGLIQGYGAPSFRFGLGLTWAPAHDDSDGDGINDDVDACPFTAEDLDGWADNDGCPDYDDDNDNFPDSADRCPREPEDYNGIDDGDGCPDGDVDGDHIADAVDMCPYDREDVDLFEDDDGCPDLDNDHDGILDSADACAEQPETINGYQDRDGCPDEVPQQIAKNIVQCRLQLARVTFDRARDVLRPDAQATLDRVAQTIANYVTNGDPPLLHVYVSGHASEEGTDVNNYDLSLRRALQVYDFLLARGISASLLARRGFGEAKPLIDQEDEESFRSNRRVEFEVELGGPCSGVAASTD